MSNIGIWENAEPGVKRKILNPGNQLMMMEVHFEVGARGNDHSHVHEQMTYCISGKVKFTIDGKDVVIETGENIVIPSNQVHGCVALEKSVILDVFTPIREDLLKR